MIKKNECYINRLQIKQNTKKNEDTISIFIKEYDKYVNSPHCRTKKELTDNIKYYYVNELKYNLQKYDKKSFKELFSIVNKKLSKSVLEGGAKVNRIGMGGECGIACLGCYDITMALIRSIPTCHPDPDKIFLIKDKSKGPYNYVTQKLGLTPNKYNEFETIYNGQIYYIRKNLVVDALKNIVGMDDTIDILDTDELESYLCCWWNELKNEYPKDRATGGLFDFDIEPNKPPTPLLVCDTTKQITQTYFNSIGQDQQIYYITNAYKIVNKISQQPPDQYLPHTPHPDHTNMYKLTNPEDFIKKIKKCPDLLDQALLYIFNNATTNNTYNKWGLDQIKKSGTNNNIGRNPEKYPIPTTEPEKIYALLNPDFRCNGIKKKGRCVWLKRVNGFCGGCNKTNRDHSPSQDDLQLTDQAVAGFKIFSKKANWDKFVSDYYINNVFNDDLYNQANLQKHYVNPDTLLNKPNNFTTNPDTPAPPPNPDAPAPKIKKVGRCGRNTEKYPIPTTECERIFVKLNPNFRCNHVKKSGRCVWLKKIDGYCKGCYEKNPPQNVNNPDLPLTHQAQVSWKIFSKKANWEYFTKAYYVNNIFNDDLYNQANPQAPYINPDTLLNNPNNFTTNTDIPQPKNFIIR